jgi:hypothetical protein
LEDDAELQEMRALGWCGHGGNFAIATFLPHQINASLLHNLIQRQFLTLRNVNASIVRRIFHGPEVVLWVLIIQ